MLREYVGVLLTHRHDNSVPPSTSRPRQQTTAPPTLAYGSYESESLVIGLSLGDDLAPEDTLDVLSDAVIGKGEHLDGFRPIHFIVFLAPVSLGVDPALHPCPSALL